jgi:hypothetical protein
VGRKNVNSPEWHATIEAGAKKEKRFGTTTFNATAQYISTTGIHAFVAPGPNDLRGQCLGLNVIANHGYIPHNGVAIVNQFI